MLSDMDLVSFAFLFGDLIVTEDEVHVFILFCERYYTLSHQAPGIIHPLWFDFYQCDIFLRGNYPILYSLFVIISCYAFASIIDILRMKLVEPYFLSTYLFRKSKECLAKFYS